MDGRFLTLGTYLTYNEVTAIKKENDYVKSDG